MEFTQKGPSIGGQHYFTPVEPVGIAVEFGGGCDLPDGHYIERCECHPERATTKYVVVEDGDYFVSEDIAFDGLISPERD